MSEQPSDKVSQGIDRDQIRRDAERWPTGPQHSLDGDALASHCLALLAELEEAERINQSGDEQFANLVERFHEAEHRLQTVERERDNLGPLFIRDCCRILNVDESDYLRMDKIAARLAKVPALVESAESDQRPLTPRNALRHSQDHRHRPPSLGERMSIQVVGDRKRRKTERETGLTIDRLIRCDNHTWEARILEHDGHRHFRIAKADWSYKPSDGPCWTTCGELPDNTRPRKSDIDLLPYAWSAE